MADSSRGEEGAGGRNLVQRGAGLELEEELARLLREEGEDLEGGLGGKKQSASSMGRPQTPSSILMERQAIRLTIRVLSIIFL